MFFNSLIHHSFLHMSFKIWNDDDQMKFCPLNDFDCHSFVSHENTPGSDSSDAFLLTGNWICFAVENFPLI